MRTNISGGSSFEPIIGFSRAVRAGNAVHLAGTGPVGADDQDAAGLAGGVFIVCSDGAGSGEVNEVAHADGA